MAAAQAFYGGLTPQFAGFGNLVPGFSGSAVPGGTPNNMNGFSAFAPQASQPAGAQAIKPWAPPAQQANGFYQAFAPAGQTAQHPVAGAQGSNYLSNLLAQAAGTPGPSIPPLPDLGIKNQGALNAINYAQNLQNQANNDNNQRFNWALQALQGQGTSAKQDIQFEQDAQNAQNKQDMVSRGLTNSTIEPTLRAGTADMASRANQRVDEGVARQFVDLLGSKQVNAPTMSALFQMMQQAMSGPQQNFGGFGGGGMNVNYGPMLGARIS